MLAPAGPSNSPRPPARPPGPAEARRSAEPGEAGYRARIRAELARRQQVNPRYSLRAFAASLELSPSFVSKLLRGTKDLSGASAASVAGKFGYSPREISQFCRLVQLETARSPQLRAALQGEVAEEQAPALLNLDAFAVIADWYHSALLVLTECRGFRPDPQLIAERLGISREEAKQAVTRLARLGLLRASRGTWVREAARLVTPSDQPHRAIRHFHLQMIEKARQALETQAVAERDITSLTLAISEDKLELAKKELARFRRRMTRVLDSGKPTQVYQLNLQFFRLTR